MGVDLVKVLGPSCLNVTAKPAVIAWLQNQPIAVPDKVELFMRWARSINYRPSPPDLAAVATFKPGAGSGR